jgi:hypothetical protein
MTTLLEADAKRPPAPTPAMVRAKTKHRIAEIDLEIAALAHEKATLRAELAPK